MIRFHLDEHFARLVAKALRQHGFDVTTPGDVDLLNSDDPGHLEFAASENRVMVTHDDDFLRLHAEGVEHAGIVFCHLHKYTASQLQFMLRLCGECFTEEEEMRGRVEFL
jgi:predicted nuclease of predicted toxin-antitoxin system